MHNQKVFKSRSTHLADAVHNAEDCIYLTSEARELDKPAVDTFFSESLSGEAAVSMTKRLQCSLFCGAATRTT